jgi:hypothetical protein
MRFSLILTLFFLASCGVKTTSFKMGQTTRSEVVAMKGEPLKEEEIPTPEGKVMVYANDEKFQLKGDIVINRFKNPNGDEKLLIFWKHKLKDCLTHSKKIPASLGSHTPPEIELSCPEEGLSVIYTEGSDSVSRVVEYEAK